MSRIATPSTIDASPAASQPLLAAVKQLLGGVPNMFRLIGTSPAALEGYLALNGALAKGRLDAATRERIALAVAELNDCGYCLAAHTALGKRARLDDAALDASRDGRSSDPTRAEAALRFATARVVASAATSAPRRSRRSAPPATTTARSSRSSRTSRSTP